MNYKERSRILFWILLFYVEEVLSLEFDIRKAPIVMVVDGLRQNLHYWFLACIEHLLRLCDWWVLLSMCGYPSSRFWWFICAGISLNSVAIKFSSRVASYWERRLEKGYVNSFSLLSSFSESKYCYLYSKEGFNSIFMHGKKSLFIFLACVWIEYL